MGEPGYTGVPFKGDRGPSGLPGRDGLPGVSGIPGRKGYPGRAGNQNFIIT